MEIRFKEQESEYLLALKNVPKYTINRVGLMFYESGTFVTPELQIKTILKFRLDGFEQLSKFSHFLAETGSTSGEVFT